MRLMVVWMNIPTMIRGRKGGVDMREYTRFLKEEYNKDFYKIVNQVSNTKLRKRSQEQNKQAAMDKYNYYNNKWNGFLRKCETQAQVDYCQRTNNFEQ